MPACFLLALSPGDRTEILAKVNPVVILCSFGGLLFGGQQAGFGSRARAQPWLSW